VLSGLNVEFATGRTSVIHTPVASAGSLLIEAIIGRLPPIRGRIVVDGVDSKTGTTAIRRQVCLVPQKFPLRRHLSVVGNVRFLLGLRSLTASTRDIRTALRRSDLTEQTILGPSSSLSALERLGVWIAVCRLADGRLLVIEELDREIPLSYAGDVSELLSDPRKTLTILATCRDRDFAAAVADDLFQIEQEHLRMLPRRRSGLAPQLSDTSESL